MSSLRRLPEQVRRLALVAALTASAAGCAAKKAATPPVPTTPKVAASEGLGHVEASDPRLRESLAQLAREPGAAAHGAVAAAYRDLGISDRAFDHLRAAVALDPRDASAHDLLARTWRDWGFPERGLAEARAAVKHAPRSAVAHNTLGTLYEALGRYGDARRAYSRALALDNSAAYALTNLTRLPALEHARRQRAPGAAPRAGTP
jgi:tetratricopeptide (TPR) repeat protein